MGKKGTNEGWEFQCGWAKDILVQRTEKNLPPSPIEFREGVKGAPVGGRSTAKKTKPPPSIDTTAGGSGSPKRNQRTRK